MPTWDRAHVAHLFRRAGFGLRQDELDHYVGFGMQASVDSLLNYTGTADPAETAFPVPDLSQYWDTTKNTGLTYNATLAIEGWWIQRMLATNRPLQEKMTLFWHGHFATAITEVPPQSMLQQNQLFRSAPLGKFDDMLKAVGRDPAMLNWLSGEYSVRGHPNENFSRELMELFALGITDKNGNPNYIQTDVTEGARALTGWVTNENTDYITNKGKIPISSTFVPNRFDSGNKVYLGQPSGPLDMNGVMDVLVKHPATGLFIVRKLFSFFAYDVTFPTDVATLQPFADVYYNTSGTLPNKYDIKEVMRAILTSDAFYSPASFQGHIKSPVEFLIGTMRELGLTAAAPLDATSLAQTLAALGQELFRPPNVAGWPGGRAWLTANGQALRFRLAGQLAATPQVAGTSGPVVADTIKTQSGAATSGALVDYVIGRFLGVGALPSTRAALITYMGGETVAITSIATATVEGLLKLVFSSPEYQLN